MKVSYFGYYVRHNGTGDTYRVDLSGFLDGFASWKIPAIKRKLGYNGERLFFVKWVPPVYMFIQARDSELIKTIQRTSESVAAIAALLKKDDSIGVASYVMVKADYLAIACRLLSPRITAFGAMVNQIFMKMQLGYTFEVRALTETVTKQQMYRFSHVGAITIDMDVHNGIAQHVLNAISANDTSLIGDVGSVEITIRPLRARKKSLKALALKMGNVIPTNGLSSFEARARKEAADQMQDVYLVGQGAIRDECTATDEKKVPGMLDTLASANSLLRDKVNKFRQDAAFPKAVGRVRDTFDWQLARAAYLALS